jgi:glycine/D-amino acid oxidase-like deaminating enzyme
MRDMAKKIVIIGSGIIGASLAYHLAAKGAEVMVLEAAGKAGGVATPNTWGWINASWGNPEPYAKLRMQSMRLWHILGSAIGLNVNWCGGLMWDIPPEDLKTYVTLHSAWGYRPRLVDRTEAIRLEPSLFSPPELAVHVAEEGVIEPEAAVRGFLDAALAEGAALKTAARVQRLVMANNRITGVLVGDQVIEADEVVVAAGVESVGLLQSVGLVLPLKESAAIVVYTKTVQTMLKGMIISPDFELRQCPDGRLLAATNFTEGREQDEIAEDVLKNIRKLLRFDQSLMLDEVRIGYRPMPVDGFPLTGRMKKIDGLYVAVTHSGITLAPAIGAFGADEILDGVRHELLALYHPDRLMA